MPENVGRMRGKRGVIMGVTEDRSIVSRIATAARAQGAEPALASRGGIDRLVATPHRRLPAGASFQP